MHQRKKQKQKIDQSLARFCFATLSPRILLRNFPTSELSLSFTLQWSVREAGSSTPIRARQSWTTQPHSHHGEHSHQGQTVLDHTAARRALPSRPDSPGLHSHTVTTESTPIRARQSWTTQPHGEHSHQGQTVLDHTATRSPRRALPSGPDSPGRHSHTESTPIRARQSWTTQPHGHHEEHAHQGQTVLNRMVTPQTERIASCLCTRDGYRENV